MKKLILGCTAILCSVLIFAARLIAASILGEYTNLNAKGLSEGFGAIGEWYLYITIIVLLIGLLFIYKGFKEK